MSEWVDIPLALQFGRESWGGSYANDSELTNLMFARAPSDARQPFYITQCPGLSSVSGVTTPGTGRIRGICRRNDDTIFVVQGTSIYYSTNGAATWTAVPVGSMPGTGYCRMADADTHVVCVDGTNARAITTAESFACSRGNFSDVAYQDGYTIFTETSSNSLYVSAIDDPTTINALDFTTVDAGPGDLLAVVSDHREVFAFKQKSIEHYYNAGGSGFPFERSTPGFIENGIPHSTFSAGAFNTVCKYDNTVFWMSHDMRAYMMRGTQPKAISTPWVEKYAQRNQPTTPGALYGAAYVLDGVLYYMISGFKDNTNVRTALICDVEAGLWCKRHISAIDSSQWVTHVAEMPLGIVAWDSCIAVVNGASGNGALYNMSTNITTDGGSNPSRVMTLPTFAPAGGRRVFMSELYLDMQLVGSSATIALTWSDDGGNNYTSAHTASIQNDGYVTWQRLGAFRQRILKFTFACGSDIKVLGCKARIEAAAS